MPVQVIEVGGGLLLKRGCTDLMIRGEGAAQAVRLVLATLAKKDATREAISDLFAVPDRPLVVRLLDQLIARRILVPVEARQPVAEEIESGLDIFYWQFGEATGRVTDRLNSRRLAILGVNCISRQLVTSLAASGWKSFQVVDDHGLRNLRLFGPDNTLKEGEWPTSATAPIPYSQWAEELKYGAPDCLVATSDFGGVEALRHWNRFCLARKRHFLPVALQNTVGFLGPLVLPGETACYECLYARQNSHLKDPETQRAPEALAFEGQVITGFHPSMASVLGDLAAFELTRFYSGILPNPKVGTLIEVHLLATRLTARKVLKVPRCPVCSPLLRRAPTSPNKDVFIPAGRAGK